jgi:membrane protein required for colicin V production
MWIDIICGLLVGYFFYLGYTKGIIKTVFGILSVLLGLLITLKFSHLAMQLMEKIINVDPRMNVILGFVLTFLLVLIAIRMLGQGLEKVLETAHINIINQLAGGAVSGLIALEAAIVGDYTLSKDSLGFVIKLKLLNLRWLKDQSLIHIF